jgi:ubiquinone/menaquinone biosynthesis C-methylase UbiE
MDFNDAGRQKSRDEIAAAYKSEPWWYDVRGFFILTFAYNNSLGSQLRFFGPNFGPRHIEVACGTGTLLEMILNWRRRRGLPLVDITGIDYTASMLAGARHRFQGRAGLHFQQADAAALPFSEGEFDTANIANSVHCFPDVNGALRGVFRVLKPGGTLAANVLLYPEGSSLLSKIARRINAWGIRKGILFTPYDQQSIRQKIVDAGFEIEFETVSGNCYNVRSRKPLPA